MASKGKHRIWLKFVLHDTTLKQVGYANCPGRCVTFGYNDELTNKQINLIHLQSNNERSETERTRF